MKLKQRSLYFDFSLFSMQTNFPLVNNYLSTAESCSLMVIGWLFRDLELNGNELCSFSFRYLGMFFLHT